MRKTVWNNGEPEEVLSKEERKQRKEEFKQAKRDKKKRKPGVVPTYHKAGKAGMHLENRVAKKWNDRMGKKKKKTTNTIKRPSLEFEEPTEEKEEPTTYGKTIPETFTSKTPRVPSSLLNTGFSEKAKRQPNSGARWHSKGDITLEHALVEVKERGTVNSRGEKYISVPKEWLTTQEDEAFQEGRPFWYLAFAYKNDDEIYVIKPYDHEIEMVSYIKELEEKVAELESKKGDN